MIRWFDVLAARYVSGLPNRDADSVMLAHAVHVETGVVMCGRVTRAALSDTFGEYTARCPSCAKTLAMWDRYISAPRLTAGTPSATFYQWYAARYPARVIAAGELELRAEYDAAEKRQCRLTEPHRPHLYGDGLACPGIKGAK